MGELLLDVKNITMKFGGVTAVNDFNLQIKKNQVVGLIGPNGAGKTTCFNIITGEYIPTEGSILFDKDNKAMTDITKLRPDQITKMGIGRTFQNIRLFKDLTVMENVMIAHHVHIKSNVFSATFRMPWYNKEEQEMEESTLALLEKLSLLHLKDEKASSLPYGLQRRLEIARALATKPQLLLLDEPAAGMNPQESLELMALLKEVKEKFDLTIFMIEHHMPVIMGVCEKILVLDHGVKIAEGDPQTIQNDPRVIEAYLGVDINA